MKYTQEMAAEALSLRIEKIPTGLKFVTDSDVEVTVAEAEYNVSVQRLALAEMDNSPVGIASGAQWFHLDQLAAWIKVRDGLTQEFKAD